MMMSLMMMDRMVYRMMMYYMMMMNRMVYRVMYRMMNGVMNLSPGKTAQTDK